MKYRKGYKYQLAETYSVTIPLRPVCTITTDFISLSNHGRLIIKSGYAWDGASGPMIDTDNVMIPSLVHDALYQLLRQRHLHAAWRQSADDIFYQLCLEHGMNRFRAWYAHRELRKFGGAAASPHNQKVVFEV